MKIGVVGAGIVGLATARALQLRLPDAEVIVIDKEREAGVHQTGHNSGVVHAGVYYAPGSLKARLCREGVDRLRPFCEKHDIPWIECGKVIVALDESELEPLAELERRATENGVPGLRRLDGAELRELEPNVAGIAALHSPSTAVTDYAAVVRCLGEEIVDAGGRLMLGEEVRMLSSLSGGRVRISTATGPVDVDLAVTCAGLHSDKLAKASGDRPEPRIVPFRGEYLELASHARGLVNGCVYPVPDPRYPFLGVHFTPTTDGRVLVGPNAVLALAREGYRWRDIDPGHLVRTLAFPGFRAMAKQHWRTGIDEMTRSLLTSRYAAEARRYVPAVRNSDLSRAGAGVRAQALETDGTLVDDFRIHHDGGIVHVRNAPSPAATSSLAIAEAIVDAALGATDGSDPPGGSGSAV